MGRKSEAWTLLRDSRTGVYTVRFTIEGVRTHRSTRTTDRATALERARAIYEAALTHRPAPGSVPLLGASVLTLCSAWLSAMEREKRPATIECWTMYVTAHWVPFFRDGSELADQRRLTAYVSKRLGEATAQTVRKECSALSTLLGWCARADVGYLVAAPQVPRPPKGATGTQACRMVRVDLTAEQVEALIEALPERMDSRKRRAKTPCRAFFRVLWETGLRRGTLYRLSAPHDYHRGASELLVREEADKAAYGRPLPLTAECRAALDSVCPKRGPIFFETDYRTQLRKAAKAIGIPEHLAGHVSHHDFRHARTTALVDSGAPLTGVAYLVGHKRISTTDGYAHARRRAAEVALAVDSGHRGRTPEPATVPKAATPVHEAGADSVAVSGASAEERTRTSTGVTHQILSRVQTLRDADFSGDRASRDDSAGPLTTRSGHGVRLAEAALAALEARGTERFESRALDVFALIADMVAAEAPRTARGVGA